MSTDKLRLDASAQKVLPSNHLSKEKKCLKRNKICGTSIAETFPYRYRFVKIRWRVLFTMIDSLGILLGMACCKAKQFLINKKWIGEPCDREPYEVNDIKRILLIQFDHIGDAVITSHMIKTMRERFPHAAIVTVFGELVVRPDFTASQSSWLRQRAVMLSQRTDLRQRLWE